jgi:hypothetical protein
LRSVNHPAARATGNDDDRIRQLGAAVGWDDDDAEAQRPHSRRGTVFGDLNRGAERDQSGHLAGTQRPPGRLLQGHEGPEADDQHN